MVGITRIHMHWSAGSYNFIDVDKQAYHYCIGKDGTVYSGKFTPEDNITIVHGKYAAHTLHANTGAIGVAVLGMGGAVKSPFNAGNWPMLPVQIDALVTLVAQLCKKYGISVTRSTVLTHAEVQPTLGVAQKGKWDITWLPGMSEPGDPIDVGDVLRARVSAAIGTAVVEKPATVRINSTGASVTKLQSLLIKLGYVAVANTGTFDSTTKIAVLMYQKAMGLTQDGIVGPKTWAMLLKEEEE